MAITTIEPGRSKNSNDIMSEYDGSKPENKSLDPITTTSEVVADLMGGKAEFIPSDREETHAEVDDFNAGPGSRAWAEKHMFGNHTGIRKPGEELHAIARSANEEDEHDRTYRIALISIAGSAISSAAIEALTNLARQNQAYQRQAQNFEGASTRLEDAASNYTDLALNPNADPMEISYARNAILDAELRATQAMIEMETQEIAVTELISSAALELANGDQTLSEQIIGDVEAVVDGNADLSSVSEEAQVILNEIQLTDGTYPTLDGQCLAPSVNTSEILGVSAILPPGQTNHDTSMGMGSYDPSNPFEYNVSVASALGPDSVQDQIAQDYYISANVASGFDSATHGSVPANTYSPAPEVSRSQPLPGTMEYELQRAMNGPSMDDYVG